MAENVIEIIYRSTGAGQVRGEAEGVSGAFGRLGGVVTGAARVAAAGVGVLAAGFGAAVVGAISMNSTLETSTLQFTTLMGDAQAAEEHVRSLFEFAKATPFETGPIIEASKLLQTFGGTALNTQGNLTLIGDAAAATNAPINELGFWVGRLYSNLQAGKPFGEASARLGELAVMSPQARQQMEDLQAAGASADEIFKVFQDDLGRFGGAMVAQAGTWQGLMSTIKDSVSITLATALKPFFDIGKEGLGALATWLSSPTITEGAQRIAETIGRVAEGFGRWISVTMQAIQAGGIQELFTIFEDGSTRLGGLLELFGVGEERANQLAAGFINIMQQGRILIANVLEFVEPITTAVVNFMEWKDVLIAVGVVIGGVLLSAVVSLAASLLPIIAAFAAIVAAVALVRQVWENDFLGIRTALEEFWNNVGLPVFTAVQSWLQINIPIALQFLSDFWQNVLLPAIQSVWSWIEGTLFPTLQTAWNWLATNIPAALETLRGFWQDTLLPAIQAVWSFIQDNLFPLFDSLVNLWFAAVRLELTALQGLWENVLLPAIEKVWQFITDSLIPAVSELITWIGEKLSPVLTAAQGFFQGVNESVGGLSGVIQTVIGWIQGLIDKLNGITLPEWMTPGSPTPWEMGLRGVASALQDLNRIQLPAFEANMRAVGGAPAGAASQTTYQRNPTLVFNQYNYGAAADPTMNDLSLAIAILGGV